MERNKNREEAERWLEVAEKLLMARDLIGSKGFASRAREKDPFLDGVDQITAISDTLLAAEKRINNHMDWYAILQLDRRSTDLELMKRQYRRLALLLHPDKNKYIYAENAFKLVNDAWAVLSDPSKKSLYDNELNLFLRFDPVSFSNTQPVPQPPLPQQQPPQQAPASVPVSQAATPLRRSQRRTNVRPNEELNCSTRTETTPVPAAQATTPSRLSSFWTVCPYCYNLYQYPRVYEDCCLRCQNCRRAFHATVVPRPPPIVPGKDAYYCCWAFFPIGFVPVPTLNASGGKKRRVPNWTPFTPFPPPQQGGGMGGSGGMHDHSDRDDDDVLDGSDESWDSRAEAGSRKRGKSGGNGRGNASLNKGSTNSQTNAGNVKIQGQGNLVNETPKDGPVVQGSEQRMAQRRVKKTVARRAKKPVRRAVGGRSDTVWIDMDLNVEIKEADDVAVADGEGIGSIEEEATEGIGFFEGLDDFLGTLPILAVPEEQKVASAHS